MRLSGHRVLSAWFETSLFESGFIDASGLTDAAEYRYGAPPTEYSAGCRPRKLMVYASIETIRRQNWTSFVR